MTRSSPIITFLRKLIVVIFDKDENDRDIIFKFVFILSQINSPFVLPAYSLKLLNQKKFSKQDKDIVKANVKLYIQALLTQEGIDG